jgi:hypothetical protein
MTEAEWLACSDPRPMLRQLHYNYSHRKKRLFACDCARRLWELLPDGSRQAVETAERFADDEATKKELIDARTKADEACRYLGANTAPKVAAKATGWDAVYAAEDASAVVLSTVALQWGGVSAKAERVRQCCVLRDLVGNPFRSVVLDPAWLAWSGDVVPKIAQAIYGELRFADLPILADALEDAGCADAAILAHCRSGGEHVRGCWVIDLLLGKA